MKKYILSFFSFLLVCTVSAQFAVGHTQITYNDPARSNRAIQTEIYYPAAAAGNDVPVIGGAYPVIVFGHGFVMVWSAYQNIWESLVPQGYIVAFPRTEGSISPVHAEFGLDLAFLVGAIQADGNNSNSLFFNHVDVTAAIMGHSMGGGSSFLAAENNTNITTMVTFAAANTTPSSIAAAQNVSVPSLVIAGQNDCVAPPAQHQVPMYDSLASACKAYVEILGGGHCYFAETNFNCSFGEGTCTPNPTITRFEQQDAAQDFTLLWLNYYLKNDCAAWIQFNDSLANSNRVTGTASCNVLAPLISPQGNSLVSTSATSYQWFLNGNPINGANAQTYTPTQNGVYTVEVTYYNTCPYISNQINWTVTGFEDAPLVGGFTLYPNPTTDNTNLRFFAAEASNGTVYIANAIGQIVMEMPLQVVYGENQIRLNASSLPKGYYTVSFRLVNGQLVNSPLIRN
jgi:dienelactone hydrolase